MFECKQRSVMKQMSWKCQSAQLYNSLSVYEAEQWELLGMLYSFNFV